MALKRIASDDALLARADRAIEDAIAARAEVRAGLAAAGQRRACRPWAGEPRPSMPQALKPWPRDPFLEPWWTMAPTLAAALRTIWEADHELEVVWHRAQPMIQTSPALVRG